MSGGAAAQLMDATVLWSDEGVLVIGIVPPPSRMQARVHLRQAVREAAAQWLEMDIEAVSVKSKPGAPPRLLLTGRTAGVSFTHDEGLSLAAIHLHGPVGIDVMRVQDIADWFMLARDYLGPQVADDLAACPAAQRPLALAQAWTAREAALKCAGLPLAEWNGAAPVCRWLALPLPAPHVATVAY
jgi:4'-phosphopantetheinyl transferase